MLKTSHCYSKIILSLQYAPRDSTLGKLNLKAEVTTDFGYAFKKIMKGGFAAIGNIINLEMVTHQGYTLVMWISKLKFYQREFLLLLSDFFYK